MAQRLKWQERRFDFDFAVELHPEILERLRGTPARLEDRVLTLPGTVLTRRDGESWSIQENAGHLLDSESLFLGRLDDYAARLAVLRPADLTNRRTHAARYNERPLTTILNSFRERRAELITRLERMDEAIFGYSIQHPRLQQRMRLVDMMFFQAEHDDYHLARISELIAAFMLRE